MADSTFAQGMAAPRPRKVSVEGPLITFELLGDMNSPAIYGGLTPPPSSQI